MLAFNSVAALTSYTREVGDSSVLGVLPLRLDGADDAHECASPAHSGTFLCQGTDIEGFLNFEGNRLLPWAGFVWSHLC